MGTLPESAYTKLLALRTGLRRFERWSEQRAAEVGLTASQHQLLLAIKGHDRAEGPTIGEAADYLLLRHNSAVELVGRAETAGLLTRDRDPADRRVVRLHLTAKGSDRLEQLATLHIEELDRLTSEITGIWSGLGQVNSPHGFERLSSAREPSQAVEKVRVGRVYDKVAGVAEARSVLVDRLWPRGLAKTKAPFQEWLRDVAPSTELRKWYGHQPQRFEEFARRYRRELERSPAKDALDKLRLWAGFGELALLTATHDLEHSGAAVVKDVLTS